MAENNINLFNKNFYCDDINSIIEIYQRKNDIYLFNNSIIFKSEKFMHPLFLNYNYCLFCYNKRKTKYFSQNLIKSHNNDMNSLNFMKIKNIKLKKPKNKKEKIVRRYIHSFEFEKNNNNRKRNQIENDSYLGSDTELYVNENIRNNGKNENIINKNKNNINNKYINNSNINKTSQYKLSKLNSVKSNISIERNNINQEQDKTINSKDFSNCSSNEMGLCGIKFSDNDYKAIIKPRKKTFNIPSYPIMKLKSEKINNNKILNIIEANKNDEAKNEMIAQKKKMNKSSDLLLNSEDITNYSPGYLSLLKNFALNSINKLRKSENLNNNRYSITKENLRRSKAENGNNNSYKIKNENCSICLGEIEEKFTLICGDFFCRECITQIIKNCLKDISKFEKICCPLCKEKIEDNTLKKLLSEEEFIFYKKTSIRIKGIKDKNLIPCPYPDCEGFAEKASSNKNIYCCQNNHVFCGKCMEVVDRKFLKEDENKHKCRYKNDINIKYLKSQKNIKRCPNCNCWVIKEIQRCNNMTCSNIWCQYQFCWICLRAYDENHYKNPLSMCFGFANSNSENNFTKGKGIRLIRCIIIFSIIIFIILPIILILFSFIAMVFYIVIFVLDGSALGYIKLKSKFAHRLFYRIAILFYICISFALIPIGYMSFGFIIIFIPAICLINKTKKENEYD